MNIQKKGRHRPLASVNAKVGRNINRSIVLSSIRERQPISRASISTITELNKSTVSSIVKSLIEENLIEEDIVRNENVGRNPIDLRIRKGHHFVGAIYFDSEKTELAIVDIDGTIKVRDEIKTEMKSPQEFIPRCLKRIQELRHQAGATTLNGLGITVAGIVDSLQSKVLYAPNLGWENLSIGQLVQDTNTAFDNITVENDAKASALAELFWGRHVSNPLGILFLAVGHGIGAGIVLDNRILSGSSHAAGEFGHMTIVEGGEQCSCGNQGCWEMYASDRATLRRYAIEKGISLEQARTIKIIDVIEAAKRGDEFAQKAILKTSEYLGIGIANIICSYDPEVIIIGGSITQVWDLVHPKVVEIVNKRKILGNQRSNKILPTSLIDNPPLLGAAALSIQKIFADYRFAL
jgi:predicted NBD/HSP70 family sugar kinase